MTYPYTDAPDDADAQALLADAVADAEGFEPDPAPDTPEGGGEAARWRRRLRDAEAERDALTERLTAAQRAEVQRLASADLADGKDLWLAGVELADLLDDDGNVDPARVTDATTAALADRPHWAPRTVPADPDQGRSSSTASPPSFAEFLRSAGQG